MTPIKFIPPQTGPITSYSVRALQTGPLWLLIKDAGVLMTALPYLPMLFLPIQKKNANNQPKSLRLLSMRDIAIQALLLLIELILLILFLPALVSFPGILFIGVATLSLLIIKLIAWPTQGPRIVESTMDQETLRLSQQHPFERWIFINGICTGSTGLQQNIDRLSLLFGRKVTGIHNESYGFISDLLECLLQRCLSYNTTDVRIACEVVRDRLVDPEVKKVVLIGYSQGGIVASMVVDYLLAELSAEMMGKLKEIYTFGSAASHFHNPPRHGTTLLPCSSTTTESSPCIPHIEHYANEYDMVPRWGVLYATNSLLTNRYAGEVFVRMGASGHMFVDHYLDPIFPLAGHGKEVDKAKAGKKGIGRATVNGDVHGHRVEEADSYLGAIVNVDTDVEEKQKGVERKSLTNGDSKKAAAEANKYPGLTVNGKGKKAAAEVNSHSVSAVNQNEVGRVYGTINGIPNDEHVVDVVLGRGKTVKELSRLWKYLGGAAPED
ncbi:MAG: hypothetical protein Q9184_005994 [Pyrenodesmia sp. 2 TL-2023]